MISLRQLTGLDYDEKAARANAEENARIKAAAAGNDTDDELSSLTDDEEVVVYDIGLPPHLDSSVHANKRKKQSSRVKLPQAPGGGGNKPRKQGRRNGTRRNVRNSPGGEISARGTVSAMRQVVLFDRDTDKTAVRNETLVVWMLRALINQARVDCDSDAFRSFSSRLNERVAGLDARGVVHAIGSTKEDRQLLREYLDMALNSSFSDAPNLLSARFDADLRKIRHAQ